MVLIFSDENDFSTNDVLDWLIHWRIPFVRVNEQNCINIGCVNLDNNGFEYSLEIKSPYRKHISLKKSQSVILLVQERCFPSVVKNAFT